jgi:DNA-binding transcriptional MocR family regulator
VSAPVQHAAAQWLQLAPAIQRAILARVRANLQCWRNGLESGARMLPVEGGWSGIIEVPRTRTEDQWVLALLDRGILVQPGYYYDFERDGLLVASLLPRPECTLDGLRVINQLIRGV